MSPPPKQGRAEEETDLVVAGPGEGRKKADPRKIKGELARVDAGGKKSGVSADGFVGGKEKAGRLLCSTSEERKRGENPGQCIRKGGRRSASLPPYACQEKEERKKRRKCAAVCKIVKTKPMGAGKKREKPLSLSEGRKGEGGSMAGSLRVRGTASIRGEGSHIVSLAERAGGGPFQPSLRTREEKRGRYLFPSMRASRLFGGGKDPNLPSREKGKNLLFLKYIRLRGGEGIFFSSTRESGNADPQFGEGKRGLHPVTANERNYGLTGRGRGKGKEKASPSPCGSEGKRTSILFLAYLKRKEENRLPFAGRTPGMTISFLEEGKKKERESFLYLQSSAPGSRCIGERKRLYLLQSPGKGRERSFH